MSESKVCESIVDKVQTFCMEQQFENAFESFAEAHYEEFESCTECKDDEEHPLVYYDIYNDYLRTFESKIEDFLARENLLAKDFYAECRELLEDDEVWDSSRFFVEALLATSDYDSFYRLMRAEMVRIKKDNSSSRK